MKYVLAIIGFFQVLTGFAVLMAFAGLLALSVFAGFSSGLLTGLAVFLGGMFILAGMGLVASLFTRVFGER
jgi:hypothetical protein